MNFLYFFPITTTHTSERESTSRTEGARESNEQATMPVVNRAVYAGVMGTILIWCYLRRRMHMVRDAKEKKARDAQEKKVRDAKKKAAAEKKARDAMEKKAAAAKEKTMAYAAKFQLETVRKLDIAYRDGGYLALEREKLEKRLELIIAILERERKYRTQKEEDILARTESVHWNGKIFNFHHYGMGGIFGEGKIPPPREDTEEDIEDW